MKELSCFVFSLLVLTSSVLQGGDYFEVSYPPSTQPGELMYGTKFTIWIPAGVRQLRGVIVHQHGCGQGACASGEKAAYDLQWQALARKWDCALLGPRYYQEDQQDCRQWCDPRNGSAKVFLQSLRDLGAASGHPELERVPWCLWGHSGGAFWSSLMQTLYPDRIVAIWLRSGTAFYAWDSGEIPLPQLSQEALSVPTICNPGRNEESDPRFARIWSGSLQMFQQYRQRGALIGFVPDPTSAHDCRASRSLAIPFFDTCLRLRLPDPGGSAEVLKKLSEAEGMYAPLSGDRAYTRSIFDGDFRTAVWLPAAEFVDKWQEYVKSGNVTDLTPPEVPVNLKAKALSGGGFELSWSAFADRESGLSGFKILREGKPVGEVLPSKESAVKINQWQVLAFHDTPTDSQPEMKWKSTSVPGDSGEASEYQVQAINGGGILSAISLPAELEQ